MNQRKFSRLEFVMGVLSLLLNIVGLVLFFVSYTTGYYKFGEMNSPMILSFFLVGIGMEIFSLLAMVKWGDKMWTRFLTFAITALLVAGCDPSDRRPCRGNRKLYCYRLRFPVTAVRKPFITRWQLPGQCFWECSLMLRGAFAEFPRRLKLWKQPRIVEKSKLGDRIRK